MRLIDADALFNRAIEEKRFVFRLEELTNDMTVVFKTVYGDLHEFIEVAPTINPADLIPKGRWVDKPTGRYGQMQSWCTHCGQHSGIGGIEKNRHRPFCPNCGANMKEG